MSITVKRRTVLRHPSLEIVYTTNPKTCVGRELQYDTCVVHHLFL